MRRIAGLFILLLTATACSASAKDAMLRAEVEGAYWIVSDGCAYSTNETELAPLVEGKKRYQHHKVQALGQPRATIFDSVEAQVNEMLAQMDIDCPIVDSPQALDRLAALAKDLDLRLVAIERLLREPDKD